MKTQNLITSPIVNRMTIVSSRVLTVAILLLALSGMAIAAGSNGGCSNATLKGNYAFTILGETRNPNGTTSVSKGIAMTNFDGTGGLTQVDFVVSDGAALPGDGNSMSGFHFQTGETGTYTVNPDCTGHAEIDLNVPVPMGLSRGVIKLLFVLSNQGRAIHTVVAEFTPPGATAPVLSTTRSDGFKVEVDEQ
jgi:hypothetical protein